MPNATNVTVCDHPLIQHKLAYIRDARTSVKDFRDLIDEVATLMAYEITRNLPLEPVKVRTPLTETECRTLSGKGLALVPILRAGLGMIDGILKLIPTAKVGHIGLYRDPKTLQAVEYYVKLPTDIGDLAIIVIDPMLATGGSASAAIQALKNRGCSRIRLMSLIAAPEGIAKMREKHPDVEIYVAAIDEKLDERGYILPGLGDAGDRLFGTLDH